MKTKVYQKPTMKVVKLQHQCQILTGSNGGLKSQNYELEDDPFANE